MAIIIWSFLQLIIVTLVERKMTFDICTEGFFETVVEKLGIIYEDFKLT